MTFELSPTFAFAGHPQHTNLSRIDQTRCSFICFESKQYAFSSDAYMHNDYDNHQSLHQTGDPELPNGRRDHEMTHIRF